MINNFNFQTKNDLRAYAKKHRSSLNINEISKKVCQNLEKQEFYQESENILAYYPFNSEISLCQCLMDDSKNWFLPKVDMQNKEITIHVFRHGEDLVPNKWGVLEPSCCEEVDPQIINLAIIPALMADRHGYRLGYGAGFYDRFLKKLNPECIKIVAVPESLFVTELPKDEWDLPVDAVVTEKGIFFVL